MAMLASLILESILLLIDTAIGEISIINRALRAFVAGKIIMLLLKG